MKFIYFKLCVILLVNNVRVNSELTEIKNWIETINNFEKFKETYKVDELKVESCSKDAKDDCQLKFYEGKFSGKQDDDGKPNSYGTLKLLQPTEIGDFENVIAIEGTFANGLAQGPMKLVFKNGSKGFAMMENSLIKGLCSEHGTKETKAYYMEEERTSQLTKNKSFWRIRREILFYEIGDKTIIFQIASKNCNPVVFHREDSKVYSIEKFKVNVKNAFVTVDHEEGKIIEDIKIPEHVEPESSQESLELMATLVSNQCKKAEFEPYDNFVIDEELIEDEVQITTKIREANNELDIRTYFANIRKGQVSDDEVCSEIQESLVMYPPEGSVHKVMFAGYPGSGVKWILSMLQATSGIGTECGGYFQPNEKNVLPLTTFTVKTHQVFRSSFLKKNRLVRTNKGQMDYRAFVLGYTGGRAVLVLRNPYDAILSFWHHYLSKDILNKQVRQDIIEETFRSKDFRSFAKHEVKMWESAALDWIEMATDLHVVHFENMKENYKKELERLHKFLKVPIDEDHFSCLEKFPIFRTKRTPYKWERDPFAKSTVKEMIESIEKVDKALKAKNFEPIPKYLYKFFY